MNILIIEGEASTKLGGAEMSMFSFIKYLNDQNANVFLSYQIEGDWLMEDNNYLFADSINVDISTFRVQGLFSFIKELKKFVRFCQKNNIDLILTHTIHGFVFLRIAKLFIKTKLLCYFKWQFSKSSIGFLNKWGVNCIDMAVCLPSISTYWKNNGVHPKHGLYELYNGIKCEVVHNILPIKKEKQLKIVFFGRITKEKGVGLLVEVAEKLDFICIHIYGLFDPINNEYHFDIKEHISNKGLSERIQFCGFVNNPSAKMKNYHLAIVPSITYEAQGRVLFEAMCSSTVPIASKIGGMPAILGKYQDILTFEPKSEGIINCIQKVRELSEEDIIKMKEYYRKRFLKNYTEKVTQESLYVLTMNLFNNKSL